MTENWVSVPGFEDYEVSNMGRIRSRRTKTRKKHPLVLSPGVDSRGYPMVNLCSDDKKRCVRVHTLVLECFSESSLGSDMECRYLNGNPEDNRLENLRWGTREQNASDMVRHGNSLRGERNPHAKLNSEAAKVIAWASRRGIVHSSVLAGVFDVSDQTVCDIKMGRSWRHKTSAIRSTDIYNPLETTP